MEEERHCSVVGSSADARRKNK